MLVFVDRNLGCLIALALPQIGICSKFVPYPTMSILELMHGHSDHMSQSNGRAQHA